MINRITTNAMTPPSENGRGFSDGGIVAGGGTLGIVIPASCAITPATRLVTSSRAALVIAAAHQRDCFPLKTSDLPVRQNRFQAIANFNAGTMILDGI